MAARKTWLSDALREALRRTDPAQVKQQIREFAPADAQQMLASAGIRDEDVFPVPAVLEAQPTLVGYYRLLLGVPQKTFYGAGTGMRPFRSMEVRGSLGATPRAALPDFCKAMGESLAELVRQLSPTVTPRDIAELPLLTIGSQFQGANNNAIGKQATIDVFLSVGEIVKDFVAERTERRLKVRNASGRIVLISLASDPDVRVQEEFSGSLRNTVAIEIKGGTDKSNAHNRAGEAEKSHQKAKAEGFRDFWTIITKKGLDMSRLQAESPTTNSWFDAAQVLGRSGPDWHDFARQMAGAVGIPEPNGLA